MIESEKCPNCEQTVEWLIDCYQETKDESKKKKAC